MCRRPALSSLCVPSPLAPRTVSPGRMVLCACFSHSCSPVSRILQVCDNLGGINQSNKTGCIDFLFVLIKKFLVKIKKKFFICTVGCGGGIWFPNQVWNHAPVVEDVDPFWDR